MRLISLFEITHGIISMNKFFIEVVLSKKKLFFKSVHRVRVLFIPSYGLIRNKVFISIKVISADSQAKRCIAFLICFTVL